MSENLLDGSTECGPENAWPADPGEFAARWNALGDPERARWLASAVDAMSAMPELDRLRAEVERLERRLGQCRAEHPTNPTVVPCVLNHGHDGDEHVSSTGCAGSVVRWPCAEAERDVLRARLAKVEALADKWAAWSCRSEEGHEDSDVQCVSCLSADLRAVLVSVPEPSDSEPERRCSQCGRGISDRACGPTHALLYAEQKKACEPAPDADREAGERP